MVYKCYSFYLPHGYLPFSEEEQVNLPWHLGRLAHVHEVLEELLDRRDGAHVLQTSAVAVELLLATLRSGATLHR